MEMCLLVYFFSAHGFILLWHKHSIILTDVLDKLCDLPNVIFWKATKKSLKSFPTFGLGNIRDI